VKNKIKARIDPLQLEAVSDSLKDLGIEGQTFSSAKIYGSEKDPALLFRMKKQSVLICPETMLEVIADQDQTEAIVAVIQKVQKTGPLETSRIEIQSIEETVWV
jgi:nitrogen regulatory protein PII